MQNTGGIPRIVHLDAFAAGWVPFPALSMHVVVQSASDLKFYTSQADFDGDVNAFTIPAHAAGVPDFQAPLEDQGMWLRPAAPGGALSILVLCRKG